MTATKREKDAYRIVGENNLMAVTVRKQLEIAIQSIKERLPQEVVLKIVSNAVESLKGGEEKFSIVRDLLNPTLQGEFDFGFGNVVNPGPRCTWTIHTHVGEKFKNDEKLQLFAVNSVEEFVKCLYDKDVLVVNNKECIIPADLNRCFIKNLGRCRTACGETNFIDYYNKCPSSPLFDVLIYSKDGLIRRDSALLFGLLYYEHIHMRLINNSLVCNTDKKVNKMKIRKTNEWLKPDYFLTNPVDGGVLPFEYAQLKKQVQETVKVKNNDEVIEKIKLIAEGIVSRFFNN